MEAENFPPRWPFDATRTADALEIRVYEDSIPPDLQGKIVAKILPLQRQIVLDQDIPELHKGFRESTIAHEIGHWVLLINQDEADGLTEQLELSLGMEDAVRLFCPAALVLKFLKVILNS